MPREDDVIGDDSSFGWSREGTLKSYCLARSSALTIPTTHLHHLYVFPQRQRKSYKDSNSSRKTQWLTCRNHDLRAPLIHHYRARRPFPAIEVTRSASQPSSAADGQWDFIYIAHICADNRPTLVTSCNSHADPIYPTLLSRVIPGVRNHLHSWDNIS